GRGVRDYKGRPFDFVLFLTAKFLSLNPLTRKTEFFTGNDFSNREDLFRQIITYTEWMDTEEIDRLDDKSLTKELGNLFDTLNIILVIDDIDSLTTKNLDGGLDIIYRLLSRSAAGGKVLYTLRNAPSQSISSSIEVPGLDPDTE